jgi:hypothetical protein
MVMWSRYEQAARRAVAWLGKRLEEDGSYGPENDDLACHCKSPLLFATAGRLRDALRAMDHIERRFLRPDGDFATQETMKSANPLFTDLPAYPNGWIAMAAHRLGRFGTAARARAHLAGHGTDGGGFRTSPSKNTDALTTAHLGLMSLQLGDAERAVAAARHLAHVLDVQPDLGHGFYSRLDGDGRPVTEAPDGAARLHFVSATEPDQAYFVIGRPIAFLTLLADATDEAVHLETACGYLRFALSCTGDLRTCHYSHQVAWGAALLANATGDGDAARLAADIAGHLADSQAGDGPWLPDEPPYVVYDQTAEVATLLFEIDALLSTGRAATSLTG